ncbi:hypothetical protein WJ542_06155 [Paraburkholderia sp. B3]|uniref:hypothetical protein n=1 Tax=Paraburkholderia sp. B3 TaxID=3134791 RepID=UPI003981E111
MFDRYQWINAGLMVRESAERWVKAGAEYNDGALTFPVRQKDNRLASEQDGFHYFANMGASSLRGDAAIFATQGMAIPKRSAAVRASV